MSGNRYDTDGLKAEEKRLYEEYKLKLAELKKVQKEKDSVGQVFTKGLLPLYVVYTFTYFIFSALEQQMAMIFPTRSVTIQMVYGFPVQAEFIPFLRDLRRKA
jgi:hypothetical protein